MGDVEEAQKEDIQQSSLKGSLRRSESEVRKTVEDLTRGSGKKSMDLQARLKLLKKFENTKNIKKCQSERVTQSEDGSQIQGLTQQGQAELTLEEQALLERQIRAV